MMTKPAAWYAGVEREMTDPTSILLTARTREQLCDLGGRTSEVIARAVDLLHRAETTGDLWVGTGPWQGWRLTTAHSTSSYGQPVLVRPDGTALGPGDVG
jgi:hypothetical protein